MAIRLRAVLFVGLLPSCGGDTTVALSERETETNVEEITLPYTRDFSDGSEADWRVVTDSDKAPNWTVTEGQYHQTAFAGFSDGAMLEGYHRGTYAYLAGGATLTDYRVRVAVTPLAQSGQDIGVMLRTDPNTQRYLRLSLSAANGFARLEARRHDHFETLAKNDRGFVRGVPLSLELEAKGPIVIARIDGQKVFAGYEQAISSGTVGLYCRDACAFDDVTIEAATTTPTIALLSPVAYSVSASAALPTSAVVLNKPSGASVGFQLDGADCPAATEPKPGLFATTCNAKSRGVFTVTATLFDVAHETLDTQTSSHVAVGDNYVALGDSITTGMDDGTSTDAVTRDGWMISSQGYVAPLIDLLNAGTSAPSIVHNASVPGDTSSILLNERLTSRLEAFADANHAIVMIGVNDANGPSVTASGLGCSGAECKGTYKGNLQATVDRLIEAGKPPIVASIPPRFGDPFKPPYPDPMKNQRNVLIRDEYNVVIAHELSGHLRGPDLYDYFLESENRFYLYATNMHPNALGYQVIAHLLFNSITGNTTPPFVLSHLCLRSSQSGSCAHPFPYKQNLLEAGDRYFVDQEFTLSTIPSHLTDGRWIMTSDRDRDMAHTNYLTFDVPSPATVSIAYDANATSLPSWLAAGYADSGTLVTTNSPAAPALRLYSRTNVSGTVTLGGAGASEHGAHANYLVVVVEQ